LPGKDLSYEGPVLLKEICNQIVLDAEQQGLSITEDQAVKVIRAFFLNVKSSMKKGKYVDLDVLGSLGLSPEAKKRKIKEVYKEAVRVKYTRKRRMKRTNFNQNLRKQWKKHCEMRVSKGLKPWRYKDWATVFKKRKMQKLKPLRIERIE
jgi:nucleoid DNA-binding protein